MANLKRSMTGLRCSELNKPNRRDPISPVQSFGASDKEQRRLVDAGAISPEPPSSRLKHHILSLPILPRPSAAHTWPVHTSCVVWYAYASVQVSFHLTLPHFCHRIPWRPIGRDHPPPFFFARTFLRVGIPPACLTEHGGYPHGDPASVPSGCNPLRSACRPGRLAAAVAAGKWKCCRRGRCKTDARYTACLTWYRAADRQTVEGEVSYPLV